MLFSASYSKINVYFTAGKQIWGWNCHVTRWTGQQPSSHLYCMVKLIWDDSSWQEKRKTTWSWAKAITSRFFPNRRVTRASNEQQTSAASCQTFKAWSPKPLNWRPTASPYLLRHSSRANLSTPSCHQTNTGLSYQIKLQWLCMKAPKCPLQTSMN